jgi:hypothetical protein
MGAVNDGLSVRRATWLPLTGRTGRILYEHTFSFCQIKTLFMSKNKIKNKNFMVLFIYLLMHLISFNNILHIFEIYIFFRNNNNV